MPNKPDFATLFLDTLAMSISANAVIAMRLTKMTLGGVDPHQEGVLMISEKIDAATEATFAAAMSIASGAPHHAAGCAMAVYRRQVDLNLRRLIED